jgi:hypothetical protein
MACVGVKSDVRSLAATPARGSSVRTESVDNKAGPEKKENAVAKAPAAVIDLLMAIEKESSAVTGTLANERAAW